MRDSHAARVRHRRSRAAAQALATTDVDRSPCCPFSTPAPYIHLMSDGCGHLLAILANAPASTSGDRTRRRVVAAKDILGCKSASITNLFAVPTANVVDIATTCVGAAEWQAMRPAIAEGITRADAILLAWGCTEPSGPARAHHRAQVAWLTQIIKRAGLPVWTVGGAPRHPSRWQRYTSRAYPSLAFNDALAISLDRRWDALPSPS
jgi:hypothetical protein